jgi:hypothetical protein
MKTSIKEFLSKHPDIEKSTRNSIVILFDFGMIQEVMNRNGSDTRCVHIIDVDVFGKDDYI